MIWYCDSSALLKRYVREGGSRWFREQLSQHRLLISALAIVEVPSALARRQRRGTITILDVYRGRTQFEHPVQAGHYEILPVADTVLKRATHLIYHHPLAAYDAVQLATAIDHLKNSGINARQFFFVTADDQLRHAAESEGLQTENPNDYS